MTLKPGSMLNNRYQIISILGQGGMGAVYQALDLNLSISVAVKENLFLSEEYARQFKREANILASLRHPNLPHVTDYFSVEGQGQYLVMNFIDGEDLRKRIERLGSIPPQEAILIGAAITDALSYLHNRDPQIIHRDIKPGNIKITPEGEAVLVDFGLAKVMEGSQNTTTGARAMTPGYSPPEQYGTAHTDVRSDVYALGATLYAAMTGVIPEDSLARATGKAELTDIRSLQPKVSRQLASVIEHSLSIDQDDRFQTAEEFKNALLNEIEDLSSISKPRFFLSPPPPAADAVSSNGIEAVRKPLSILKPISANSNRKKKAFKGKRKKIGNLVPSIIFLAVLLSLVYYFQPSIFTTFFAGINQRFSSTSFAQTPPEVAEPTPAAVVEQPTSAPTADVLMPTATAEEDLPETLPTAPAETPVQPSPMITEPAGTPHIGGGIGQIAFASDRTGSVQIWLMNSDGTKQIQLTDITEGVCQPDWSPDGQKLAVISPCDGKRNPYYEDSKIYILNADGSDMQLLPISQEGDFDPSWSPDGNSMAFTSLRTGTAHIYVYHFDTQSLEELSNTPYPDIQPSWRPGTKQITFIRQNLYYHVWIMSDRGQTQFQLSTSGNVNDYWPVWTPDGETLLFSRSKESQFMPWLLSLDYENRGKEETRIPPLSESDLNPVAEVSVSPDGQWLAFESWPDGRNHDIYLMTIDGLNKTRLTTDPGYDFSVDWRPGGSQ